VVVIAADGEIDMLTKATFHLAMVEAVRAASRQVVVDLTDVTFLGSSGLAVLADVRDLAERLEVGFCVTGADRAVRRVLELTGLCTTLQHRGSIDEVLAELR
jgi:anti-sigma B factor antagonist